ncbi:PREDICTED: zinc finger protein 773-like [Gekko japonicus]|uniref:Zinc finger protein 773-like n=1 Tax=Gekko japonicus TaxID=146911 RepID=A0ABM1LBZ4_GEKJA|nr:PREDICTED: zinc finger protein 773-like [Gekko japonicus]XP_015283481.1 PREDICTED: zinc finger protein 773-like [Gekko japonicus]
MEPHRTWPVKEGCILFLAASHPWELPEQYHPSRQQQPVNPPSGGKEAILSQLLQPPEAARPQSFHAGTIQFGETPRETLSRLSKAVLQWLRPQEHSKEQIVDLVILEQFLSVLPTDMQAWVRAKEPGSSKEAAYLAEACLQEQEPAKPAQLPITFEDVTVPFTEKEWALLEAREKALYWEIMQDNYDNVASLGFLRPETDVRSPEEWKRQDTFKFQLSEKRMQTKINFSESPQLKLEMASERKRNPRSLIFDLRGCGEREIPNDICSENSPFKAENCPVKAENSPIKENPKNNSKPKIPDLVEKQSMFSGLSEGNPRKAEARDSQQMTQTLEENSLPQQDEMLFGTGLFFKEPPQVVAALKGDLQETHHICTECGKSCRSFAALTKHHRAHKVEKCYKCPVCEKRFSRSSNLITHQRIHTGLKPFQCTDCEKSFNNKSTLVKHQRTHTGEKPYVCLDCGKGFTQSSNLIKHQRIHTGVKPYRCPDCDRSFTQSSHFIDHQRIHTGERPYKCPDCGKGFSLCSSLIIHHRIHTGEKPFECPVCEKSFSSRSTLINHRRVHTRNKPYECVD